MRDVGKALAFLQQAFQIDGFASEVPLHERDEVMAAHDYAVFKLTDSVRGTFYIATLRPRNSDKEPLV